MRQSSTIALGDKSVRPFHLVIPMKCLRFTLILTLMVGSLGTMSSLKAQNTPRRTQLTDVDAPTIPGGQSSLPNTCSSASRKVITEIPPDDPCPQVRLDECGNPILPVTATDIVVGPEEDVVDGPVNLLYPGLDTSKDDWYIKLARDSSGCPFSLGGTVPPRNDPKIDGVNDPGAVVQEAEKLAAQLPNFLHFSGPFPRIVDATFVYKPTGQTCDNPIYFREHGEFCNQLKTGSPFHGKDIIYVHGFSQEIIKDVIDGQTLPTWPDDLLAFAPGGYWRNRADQLYWNEPPNNGTPLSHIDQFLKHRLGVPRNAKNRYVLVGWSTAQGLEVAANTVLNQIADAMLSGHGVVELDPNDPRKGVGGLPLGFCEAGCIVISHSTGAPLTDVAMSLAKDPDYQKDYGPIGFIPDHVRVHVALGGAISGSQLATTLMVLSYGLSFSPEICAIAKMLINLPDCNFVYRLRESVLWDLVPQVMQTQWASRISETPVPVLTVAGGTDDFSKYYPWAGKFFVERGFDDGVVTMDSACGRTVPVDLWPSGFYELSGPWGFNMLDPRLYDMGMHAPGHPGRYFAEQNYEFLWSQDMGQPRAAAACTPYKTSWGMIENPTFGYKLIFDPVTGYYQNHYSFVQTAEHHFDLVERTHASQADTRTILDSRVYTTGLVSSAIKSAQYQAHKGLAVKFRVFGHTYKWWIWRRDYELLNGNDQLAAADYVYDNVN
jgi:hypothetical protein